MLSWTQQFLFACSMQQNEGKQQLSNSCELWQFEHVTDLSRDEPAKLREDLRGWHKAVAAAEIAEADLAVEVELEVEQNSFQQPQFCSHELQQKIVLIFIRSHS